VREADCIAGSDCSDGVFSMASLAMVSRVVRTFDRAVEDNAGVALSMSKTLAEGGRSGTSLGVV